MASSLQPPNIRTPCASKLQPRAVRHLCNKRFDHSSLRTQQRLLEGIPSRPEASQNDFNPGSAVLRTGSPDIGQSLHGVLRHFLAAYAPLLFHHLAEGVRRQLETGVVRGSLGVSQSDAPTRQTQNGIVGRVGECDVHVVLVRVHVDVVRFVDVESGARSSGRFVSC